MNKQVVFVILLLMIGAVNLNAQQKQKFSIASFELDQFDMTAKNEQYKKIDGNGSLYAIIKVTSTNPDDDLKAYNFNFGNMKHEVFNKENSLWVYVQRNAKFVTISRQGYITIDKYDLRTTIQAGRTYVMTLASKPRSLQTQMVMFQITPPTERPAITVKGTEMGSVEEMLDMEMLDESGTVAKNLPLGSYTYKVMCVGYYPTEGSFTLNDKKQTHVEQIKLRPRFAETTLTVDADADIYVNGELKGRHTWTGRLNNGNYSVECRQLNHRTSSQYITIEEGITKSFTLTPPTPITGSVSIITNPRASISIDGKAYGLSPQNIDDLLVGQHTIILSKDGYADERVDVTVIEGEMAEINRRLIKGNTTLAQQPASIALEEATTPQPLMNPNANQELYKKYCKKWETKRWIGWLGGLSLLGLGAKLIVEGNGHTEESGTLFAISSVPFTSVMLTLAHFDKKEANRYHSDPYKLYTKRANTRMWTGLIGGLTLVGGGAAFYIAGNGDDSYENIGMTMASCGVVWTVPHILCSLNDKKKAKQYKATAFQTEGFKFKDGSSLSASIDVLGDGITHQQTLGLGLQYSF